MNEKEERKLRNKNDLLNLNRIGHRLCWVRTSLGLTKSSVASAIDMPVSSYHNRESGVRTVNADEFLALAEHFQFLWPTCRNKSYEGKHIEKITPQFLLWGITE